MEDLISHPESQAWQGLIVRYLIQTHLTVMLNPLMSSRRSSCPLSTDLSHQLKINMASDPDTRLHVPSSSSQQTLTHAIDMKAAFDTVSHGILISKIAGSSLPHAITRWMSCYLQGRQAATNFRGIKLNTIIVLTGVPPGSKCHLHCTTITQLI